MSSAGEVLYTLPNNFKAVIRGRSWLLRSQPAFTAVGNAAGYLVRVAFGAALIASVTLVWTTILAVMSSSSNSSDDRNRSCALPPLQCCLLVMLDGLAWPGTPSGRAVELHLHRLRLTLHTATLFSHRAERTELRQDPEQRSTALSWPKAARASCQAL